MRFLLPLFLIALLATSCGEDNTDNESPTVPAREEEAAVPVRWSRIQLLTDDGFIEFYNHRLSMELNQRPLIITGVFQDEEDSCNFSVTLTDRDANQLEEEADDLDVCTDEGVDNDVIIEGPSSVIALTDLNGNTINANKNEIRDFDVSQVWLCEGKRTFYSTINRLLTGRIPAECPDDAIEKF